MANPQSWTEVSRWQFGWDPDAAVQTSSPLERFRGIVRGKVINERKARKARAMHNWDLAIRGVKIKNDGDENALTELQAEWAFLGRQHQEHVGRAPINTQHHYKTGWLPPDSRHFKMIQKYLIGNVKAKSCTAPTAESTRVNRAKKDLVDLGKKIDDVVKANPHDPGLQLLNLRKEALEHIISESKVPLRGASPPQSGPFTISKIKVIQHSSIWDIYSAKAEAIRQELIQNARIKSNLGRALYRVNWVHKTSDMPVIDTGVGEVYLMHGTSDYVAQLVAAGNFRPDFAPKKPSSSYSDPRYGAMGQGTYFSDSFSKVMTYTNCSKCWAHRCSCDIDRFVILARVVLGRPSTIRSTESQRGHSVDQIKQYRHSLYGIGRSWSTPRTMFDSNEFMIKNSDQAYPEFIVYWRWADSWPR